MRKRTRLAAGATLIALSGGLAGLATGAATATTLNEPIASAPIHAAPTLDSAYFGEASNPTCSLIGYGPGQTKAEQVFDSQGNAWFRIYLEGSKDIKDTGWVLNNGFCI